MSLGAAGCGYPENRCEYLAGTLFGFRCKKYDADLKMWRDEPKRLRKCSDDAHKEWEKLRAEQRRNRSYLTPAFHTGRRVKTKNMEEAQYELWKFFKDEHDLILTAGELDDIVHAVDVFNDAVSQPQGGKK